MQPSDPTPDLVTRERFQRLRDLVEGALDIPSSEREYFFRHSGEEPDLIAEAIRVLKGDDSEWSLRLERPPIATIQSLLQDISLQPGQTVGNRYRLERKIGEGGFGTVYIASDNRLHGRTVALKYVLASSAIMRDGFQNELQVLSRLRHPGIVQILDWGECNDGMFLVMEFVEGETLRHALSQDLLSPRQRPEILLQIIEAVAAAHQIGIAHCDLKPENILLRRRGDSFQPVLVDFGTARLRGLGEPPVVGVSRLYMAPEQLTGEGSTRTDVYTLALVAKELLPEPIHPELQAVLDRALCNDPAARFGDAAQLAAAFTDASNIIQRRSMLRYSLAGCTAICIPVGWWVWRKLHFAPRNLPHLQPISSRNLLFPDRKSAKIIEFDPSTRQWIQAIPIPANHGLDGQLASIVVRRRDLGFFLNARKREPVLLAFAPEGSPTAQFPLRFDYLQQLALDPNDLYEDTVMAGMQFSTTIMAVNPFHRRVAERCSGAKGDYIGLALDQANRIYAAEYSTGEIRCFRADGSFEAVLARLEQASITSLTIGSEGTLYAAQRQRNQVTQISLSGKILRTIRLTDFAGPAHVYANPADGLLYVGNVWNDRLIIVDGDGRRVDSISLSGSQVGQGCLVPTLR